MTLMHAGYPTSVQADQQLAAGVPQGGGCDQREALAALLRLQERRTLGELVGWVDALFEQAGPYLKKMRDQGQQGHEALMKAWEQEVEARGRCVARAAAGEAAGEAAGAGAAAQQQLERA